MKRNLLELKKKELIKEYESKPENRDELNQELAYIDAQILENEENETEEYKKIKDNEMKNNISLTQKIVRDNSEFIYEQWMDDVLELHVLENCFDFARAMPLIYLDFKNRKVKNYELFKESDLRNKWTEFELKKFRKDTDNNTYHYKKEDFFPEEKKVQKEKDKDKESISNSDLNIKEIKNDNNNYDEKDKNNGFKVTILEGNIGEEIIDTSSKVIKQCEEGGMDDLD